MQKLTAKAKIAIQAQLQAVFEAIVNPEIMKNYFISKGSIRLEMGNEILWEFPEFEGSFPVEVMEIIPNQRIHFSWDSLSEVIIELEKSSEDSTLVMVQEMGYQNDEQGIQWVVGQTEGWANFLACLKAWMEYKIHLRKGAFDF